MSTLRRFQTDPKTLLNTALNIFRSKRIRTAVVEGVCDKRFLMQWLAAGSKVRFDGFDGKKLVELAFSQSMAPPYSSHDFVHFIADVDFDEVANKALHDHPSFVYHVFCFEQQRVLFNDLETYLINTNALEKLLANYDVTPDVADSIRSRLEKASRSIGAFRAADLIVQRENNLRSTVLNGIDIRACFDERGIETDVALLKRILPNWSNNRLYVDDLIEVARRIDKEYPALWALSRGHDVTEMLALHLEALGHRGLSAEKIELMLRLGCEFREFGRSPMAKRLCAVGASGWFVNWEENRVGGPGD